MRSPFETKARQIKQARALLSGFSGGRGREIKDEHITPFLPERIEYLLTVAGLSAKAARNLWLRIGVIIVGAFCVALLFKSLALLAMIPAYLGVEYFVLRRKASARSHSFEKDYAALLLSIAASVKSGLDPFDALSKAKDLFSNESEITYELNKFQKCLEEGYPRDVALCAFGASVEYPDVRLFVISFLLNHREGSSISESLQRLVKVTRQRQSFKRKVASAIAMQKLSAIGIACAFFGIGVFQYTTNQKAFRMALDHPLGFKIMVFGLCIMLFGLAWMGRLVNTRM